jgi:probable F420-dependent oxidoreductase
MQIGIGLPNTVRGIEGTVLVEWARRADAAGFSTLATIDRIVFPSYESMVTLAAAAGATERIRLMPNVLLAPTRQGAVLAKQAASLDQLSGGRLRLGLSVGGRPDDFEAQGLDFGSRGRVFDEQLALMRKVWAGEALEGTEHPVAPLPTQEGGVPILVGGTSDAAIRRTVEHGIGWTAGGAAAAQIGPFAERVRAAWADAGRPGKPWICALAYYSIGEEEESRKNLLDYYGFLGDRADRIASAPPRSPAEIRDRVKGFEAAGVDELILDPSVGTLDQVDRLAEIVL